MTDLDLAQPTAPSITLNRALIIFIASVLAMIPGWLLGAYIPLWLAPPKEMLGWTFLMYILPPCLIWSMVPVILFRRWKLKPTSDAWIYWSVRYSLLSVTWGFLFLLTFGGLGANKVYFDLTFSEFNDVPASCTAESTDDGHITYNCVVHQFTAECDVYILWWREDD